MEGPKTKIFGHLNLVTKHYNDAMTLRTEMTEGISIFDDISEDSPSRREYLDMIANIEWLKHQTDSQFFAIQEKTESLMALEAGVIATEVRHNKVKESKTRAKLQVAGLGAMALSGPVAPVLGLAVAALSMLFDSHRASLEAELEAAIEYARNDQLKYNNANFNCFSSEYITKIKVQHTHEG